MSAEWNGNLINTSVDLAIDTAILVLVTSSYVPQISRLLSATSLSGLSASYILFDALFGNIQLGHSLLMAAYAWPTSRRPVLRQIDDGELTGLRALGSVLGNLQILAHWVCSSIVLLAYCLQASPRIGLVALAVAVVHATIAIIIPVYLVIHWKRPGGWGTGLFLGLLQICNRAVMPCLIILQFIVQYRESLFNHGGSGALSIMSVGLQMLAFAAVSWRWFLRLGYWPWERRPASWRISYDWAFIPANYLMRATACALLLACYVMVTR